MGRLIDTREMYLKTVLELTEAGVVPRRARVAERLGHSLAAACETVAKLGTAGLLTVTDRTVVLTERGHHIATRVLRKHRLVEVLLYRVIGLEWEYLHAEACRWEHVVSDNAERHILALCGYPTHCPHGDPIPALAELGLPEPAGGSGDRDAVPGRAMTRSSAYPLGQKR